MKKIKLINPSESSTMLNKNGWEKSFLRVITPEGPVILASPNTHNSETLKGDSIEIKFGIFCSIELNEYGNEVQLEMIDLSWGLLLNINKKPKALRVYRISTEEQLLAISDYPELEIIDFGSSKNEHLKNLNVLALCCNLKTLNLDNCPSLSDISQLQNLPGIETLWLDGFSDSSQLKYIGTLKKLKRLSQNNTSFSDLSHLSQLPGLENFYVTKNKTLNDIGSIAKLKSLKLLAFTGCSALEDISPIKNLASLKILKLNNSYLKPLVDLSPLSELINLHTLDLPVFESLTDLSPLSGLVNLQTLNLESCTSLSDLSPLSILVNLQTLNLFNCTSLTDLSPLSGLDNLQFLNLSYCPSLIDLSPLSGMENMKTLDISGCESLADLSTLSKLDNLQTLNLSNCSSLTDLSPLSGLVNLQTLNLESCTSLSDLSPLSELINLHTLDLPVFESLTDLSPLSKLDNLQTLNLSNCSSLTDLSPLSGLVNLQTLNLCSCKSLTNLSPLSKLDDLQTLNLSWCSSLTDLSPLSGVKNMQTLDISGCEKLTKVQPLSSLKNLKKIDLEYGPNIRDFDMLSNCPGLQELEWTEKPACHSVLASAALLSEDESFVQEHHKSWLGSVRLSKMPDTFIQRLVAAFTLGDTAPWVLEALEDLVKEGRARGLGDGESGNALSAETWFRWVEAVLGLEDPVFRKAFEHALEELDPKRELEVVLIPVCTGFASLPERAPKAGKWALDLMERTLAQLVQDAEAARIAAPGAAVFYAAFGMDEEVREWLDKGTHPQAPRWRDRVMLALVKWSTGQGDMSKASHWLSQMETADMRDPAHAELARSMARSSPESATEHLEAIEDETKRAALAAELSGLPEVTANVEGLYGLLLSLQSNPDALADLLERLLATHPESALVSDIAGVFGSPVLGNSNSDGPLARRLDEVDLNAMSPLDALNLVSELKKLSGKGKQ